MENSRTETTNGVLESIVPIKESAIGSWYFGIIVDGKKYNKFGKLEDLKRIISNVEQKIGQNIKFGFRKKIKEGYEYFELKWVAGVCAGGKTLPHNNSIIPISRTWTFIENGKINVKKLKMALKCIAIDCNFLHNELNKVKK